MLDTSKAVMTAAMLSILTAGTATGAFAEAYISQMPNSPAAVGQMSQQAGNPAYIDQMPADAKPKPQAPARNPRPTAKAAPQAKAATIVDKPADARRPAFPTVGAGVAMVLVAPASDKQFPSVGNGTINR